MDVCTRLVHAATVRRQGLKWSNVGLDLQDAKLALAYGPQRDGRCAWAPAHALLSTILEAMVENTQAGCRALHDCWSQQRNVVQAFAVEPPCTGKPEPRQPAVLMQAALAMQHAQDLEPAAHQADALERLMRRIQAAHAEALQVSAGCSLRCLRSCVTSYVAEILSAPGDVS